MSETNYLNLELMESIDPAAFRAQRPYPWMNPQHFIRPEKFALLLDNLPDVADFRGSFYEGRKHGQASHDRYVLDYTRGMQLPEPWREFAEELCGATYRRFVCSLLDVGDIRFRLHWHYTPAGCEVSPHCDSRGKLGSQIFYLNSGRDWQPEWGGETVILDDEGRFPAASAPAFDEFSAEYPAATADNRSLIFARQGNSWHGVHAVTCPEGYYRKVFIVVFEAHRPARLAFKKLKRALRGKPMVTEKEGMMY